VILRIGFLCKSGYEWTQHTRIALDSGLNEEEIARIKQGASAPGWTAAETALLTASDELHKGQFISDATWTALRNNFTEKQCMDVVFTAAQYTQVSMILNSLGVQLDEGLVGDPDLSPRGWRALVISRARQRSARASCCDAQGMIRMVLLRERR